MITNRQYNILLYLTDGRSDNLVGGEADAVAAALDEIEMLRTAGDALAKAAHEGLTDIRDRSPVRPPLVAALANWEAVRQPETPRT